MDEITVKVIGGCIGIIIVVVLIVLASTGTIGASKKSVVGVVSPPTVTPASNKYTADHPKWTK